MHTVVVWRIQIGCPLIGCGDPEWSFFGQIESHSTDLSLHFSFSPIGIRAVTGTLSGPAVTVWVSTAAPHIVFPFPLSPIFLSLHFHSLVIFFTIDSNAFTWLFEGQRPPRPYRAPLWLHSPLSALSRCMRVLKCGVWVRVGDHDLQAKNWINHWANRKSSTELRNSSVLNPIIKSALSTCLHSSLATSLSYSHEERIIWIFTIAIVFHNQPEFVSIDRIDLFQQCRYQFYY